MADMGDLSAILGLLSSSENGHEGDGSSSENEGGGILDGIDADMLIKLMEVFTKLNEQDKNTDLIMALKPHLRAENRQKADRAAQLMKLMSVMTVFGDFNLFK